MRKGYKPITSDLREQIATLVKKNGIMHVSRESGRGNTTLYRLIKGESTTMSPKDERALRGYIQKFRNGKPRKPAKSKGKSGAKQRCGKIEGPLVCSRPLRHQGNHHAENGESWPRHFVHLGKQATDAVVLDFRLSLTAEQASRMLDQCHSRSCAPEAWLNQLVREKL